ncbi:unnamed protein product [Prorocentrum cordatum]|uniref:Alpha-galactosidase n=1 Tax=Prorocentrum cordatum TaxID=2364126 RepID=A0ABN9T1M7_9DINO|nr:unnamed protein product [Polarella glacialis]
MPWCTRFPLAFATLAHFLGHSAALDNGLGITPPRGWRSWNAFLNAATQEKQIAQMVALADESRLVDGSPTSLRDLGYDTVGLDDSWQDCGAGLNHSFHSPDGWPLVNKAKFPDLEQMNRFARSRGLHSGWYLNSCDCCERGRLEPNWPPQMRSDVAALTSLGFAGAKLDSCGPSQDLTEWARLLNASGRPVLLENCFDNASFPFVPSGADDGGEAVEEEACPMNLFRTGGDMRASWTMMLARLQGAAPWMRLSRPGCWAYLDMLEVGHPPGGTGERHDFQSARSWRSHFGAWAVTSSPLILSFDLTNATLMDMAWPFIANPEALRVNSDWAGEAGRLVASEYDTSAPTPAFARPCTASLDTQRWVLTAEAQVRSAAAGDGRCLSVPVEGAGQLVLADCSSSAGAGGTWSLTEAGQLMSTRASPSGEPVCAEVQKYGNHNAALAAAPCGNASAPPRSQSFAFDPLRQRLSVDVRFDPSKQRSPGMLLCVDIDIVASGADARPGSHLLSQVWAKRVSGGAVAVFMLNADTGQARDITVDLSSLGVAPGSVIRSIWDRQDVGTVAAPVGNYTAAAVAPHDSVFVLFKPDGPAEHLVSIFAPLAGPARGVGSNRTGVQGVYV